MTAAVWACRELRKREESRQEWIKFGIEITQDRAKLRQHEHQKKEQHGACRGQDKGGIAQGVGETSAHRISPDPFGAKHLQYIDQCAGGLADPRELDIHGREHHRMVGQRIGEAFAGENGCGELGNRRPQPANIRVGGQ